MRFASMLVMPGHNITFKACCPSGNQWTSMVDDIASTPDLNRTVFYHSKLGGNQGIWYTSKHLISIFNIQYLHVMADNLVVEFIP